MGSDEPIEQTTDGLATGSPVLLAQLLTGYCLELERGIPSINPSTQTRPCDRSHPDQRIRIVPAQGYLPGYGYFPIPGRYFVRFVASGLVLDRIGGYPTPAPLRYTQSQQWEFSEGGSFIKVPLANSCLRGSPNRLTELGACTSPDPTANAALSLANPWTTIAL